jgi:hypothetical protein
MVGLGSRKVGRRVRGRYLRLDGTSCVCSGGMVHWGFNRSEERVDINKIPEVGRA